MSNIFQPKRKELANVKIVSKENYDNNRAKYKLVGTVRRGFASFVTTKRNSATGKCSFVDDTSSLTKKAKNELVNFFSAKDNKRKEVACLVVDKKKASKKGKTK